MFSLHTYTHTQKYYEKYSASDKIYWKSFSWAKILYFNTLHSVTKNINLKEYC